MNQRQRSVAQRSRSVRLTRQDSGGSGHGCHSLGATAMVSNANDVHIVESAITVAGRDVVQTHHNHYYSEPLRDIRAIFRSIPNFRKIYQDMLSKVTAGTGLWLLRGDKFRIWLQPNGDIKIFWGSGMPGAGKTLLASIVIEHLEALHRELGIKVCICYVFFRYSEPAEVTVRTVLEVIVKQTLQRHPEFLGPVEETYDQHLREDTEPTEAQLLALLYKLNEGVVTTFYILDALDEAPKKIQLAVIKTLASLNVKLFITSRPLKTIEATFPEAHTFAIVAHDADLDRHIAKAIEDNAELQRLLRADPALRDEVFLRIKHNCGGMFLHASLQLDALCECLTAKSIRDTLDAFPSRIEDIYYRTWARITNEGCDYASPAKAVLVWVLNASRSMTIDEIERAVATCPVTHKFEPALRIPETTLVSICRGLITVDEDSRLVRLVHYTAKETLEGLLHEEFPHPQSLLATVCMAHLADCDFQNTRIASETEFRNVLEKDPLLAYASDAWAFHALAALHIEDTEHRIAEFIRNSNAFPAFTGHGRSTMFDILTPIHILALYNLPFALLNDLANPNVTTDVLRQSALIIASRFGHEELVAFFLALSEIRVNLTKSDGWSALMLAARYGHKGTVKLLLAHPNIQVNWVNNDGWSALALATGGTLKHLLAHPDIQVNLVDKGGWSALILAASKGQKGAVKHLLAHPDIQVNLVENDGWTALMLAARYGHQGAVKLLLARPEIQVNLVDNNGWTALMLAAQHGHHAIVECMLATGDADVNAFDNDMNTALKMSAQEGHKEIVRLLLAVPDVDTMISSTEDGHTAESVARANGHVGIAALVRDFESRKAAFRSAGWAKHH